MDWSEGQSEESKNNVAMESSVQQTEKQIEEEKKEMITLLRAAFRAVKTIMGKIQKHCNDLHPFTLAQIALSVKSKPEQRENDFEGKNDIASELYKRLLICYGYSEEEMILFMMNPILNEIFRENVD